MPTATVSARPSATPFEHGFRAGGDPQVLQEEDDFEAFAIDSGEAEQREAQQRAAAGVGAAREAAPLRVVRGDPAGPVDLVEEPVHDDKEHRDRDQAGGRLEVEARAAERADHADRDEPGSDGGDEREHRAPAAGRRQLPVVADEARGERGEHEHCLEPLAEDEQAGVDDDRARGEVGAGDGRVGHAVGCCDRLPGQRGQRERGDDRPSRTP